MKKFLPFFIFCMAQLAIGQLPTYRYGSLSNGNGSTFYALDGSVGQLRYMNDFGESGGVWKNYGESMRETGDNNLAFMPIAFDDGVVFYVIASNTGQLHYMTDYGKSPGIWSAYGEPIRLAGAASFALQAQRDSNGAKFTAMDCNTGQVYFMFDYGDYAGIWKSYSEPIK